MNASKWMNLCLIQNRGSNPSCPPAIRWSLFITGIPSLPFLLFILYSFSLDSLWCDSSPTTYSQKKNNFTCCWMLHNSQQGNFFSVRDRNQQRETAASWVILWHWEDFSIPPFSLLLTLSFSSFPAFRDSEMTKAMCLLFIDRSAVRE